jgi:competence protein ComEC
MVLFWLALAWLAGIAAGQIAALNVGQWLCLGAIASLTAVVLRAHRRRLSLFVLLTGLCLGAARAQAAAAPPGDRSITRFNDGPRTMALEGVVVEPPDIRDQAILLRVEAEATGMAASPDWHEVTGRVLVEAPRTGDWGYGDRIRAVGRLETPPEDETFSYRDYLAREGIGSLMAQASVTLIERNQASPALRLVYALRSRALGALRANLPDPEASLLSGILLGAEGSIPPEVREAFNRTGTSHIIAISGFNISLIAGALVSVFGRWLGARWGSLAAGLGILIYTVLVGASASVVRAALMGGLSLLALRLGRQTDGMASLGAAAVGMTALNPLVLGDAGFQLSFAATLGLVLYGNSLQGWAQRGLRRVLPKKAAARVSAPLSEFFLLTLAAQITTLPLTIYYFHRLSPASLAANPAILPAQPAIMVLGGFSAIAGAVWAPLGRPLAWLAWPFAAYTIRAVEFFASLPVVTLPLGGARAVPVGLMYTALAGLTWLSRIPSERRPRVLSAVAASAASRLPAGAAMLGLSILTGLVWTGAARRPDGLLHLTVLDVGAGDSVLIESPTGRHVLVDGGESPVALSDALGRRLSPTGNQIDWVVVAGTGEENLAGIAGIIEQFRVRGALIAGAPGWAAYGRLIDVLEESSCPVVAALAGQALDLGGGARLEVVAVQDRGSAWILTHGRLRVLLAAAAGADLVEALSGDQRQAPVTAVLVPQGGAAESNPADWLAGLQPQLALISVDAGNRAGLPDPETLAALAGSAILRTDLNGWIELTSDGNELWVEVERTPRP